MRHNVMDRNLWVEYVRLPFYFSMLRLLLPILSQFYVLCSILFGEVNDMAKGRDDIDVDASR